LLKLKSAHSPSNIRILSSTSVPFKLTTVQVPIEMDYSVGRSGYKK
jgi:hypothetical protein